MIESPTEKEEKKENVFIQKLMTISQELHKSSDLLHHFVTEKNVKIEGGKIVDWENIKVEFHCLNIRRRLLELKTLCPGIARKQSYSTLIENSKRYVKSRGVFSGTDYHEDILEEICVQTGEIIICTDLLREKAEGYEYAKTNLDELTIEKLAEPLREHKKPTQKIEGRLSKMNEHLRRKGQIQYIIDDWELLTNELEFFGMLELSKVSRAYMEFFGAKYEETDSLEVVEKSHMKELNRLLNKVSRTLTSYKTPL